MAQLTCEHLTLGYNSRIIIEDLNFSISKGNYLCIIGENGSGKTTLMKTLLRLHKPISGRIITGDGLLPDEIGYLPQQTQVQKDFPASVREIVLSGCQSRCGRRPFYTKEEKLLAAENMEKMGITEFAKRCYRELSGGQQQRVLLARALCATQKMLLLDEPVSGLDPIVTEEMYRLIQQLNKDGITIIMISHDIQAAMKYASHILHIGDQNFFGEKEIFRQKIPQTTRIKFL
ncbi:metal ABC transporter ATP-binding protein [Treponema sp. C6A8]|uniref:metal ABC transporter ATP-binding protein n=1 Tax=Treponema sp. C6A8 TaxID=1410609 RepID=UPI00056DFD36|nr:ABC transporter ATP-binding protein [Treponema sp. C6A8]